MRKAILNQLENSISVKNKILADKLVIELIEQVCIKLIEVYRNGKKTLLAGNGGSAADAQHIAGEFVSRFNFDRPALPSIALTTNSSVVTSIGNDYGYEHLFARQIEALGNEGDMFIAISTSGNSINILEALRIAHEKKIITVGLTGESGRAMEDFCDYCVRIPSNETPRIQEAHITIGHIICSIVEEALFHKDYK